MEKEVQTQPPKKTYRSVCSVSNLASVPRSLVAGAAHARRPRSSGCTCSRMLGNSGWRGYRQRKRGSNVTDVGYQLLQPLPL